MNATKISAAMLCTAMLWAAGAFAQRWNRCDPRYYFITPSDCTSAAAQAGKHLEAKKEGHVLQSNIANLVRARRVGGVFLSGGGEFLRRGALG